MNADRWRHDPFGGELIDGEVWGRGAVDMLNLTASMAVAMRTPGRRGLPARGHADLPRRWPTRRRSAPGAPTTSSTDECPTRSAADYVITESGGIPIPSARRAEAAGHRRREGLLLVHAAGHGARPGHGSQPYRTDNALVKAAEVVRRIAELPARRPDIHDDLAAVPRRHGAPEELVGAAARPDDVPRGASRRSRSDGPPVPRLHPHDVRADHRPRRHRRSTSIPDAVDLQLDIRTLPGQTEDDVRADARRGPRRPGGRRRARSSSARRAIDAPRRSTRRCGTPQRLRARASTRARRRAVAHRRRHRRPLLPAAGHDGLRLRPLQPADLSFEDYGVDVPRRRRARRRQSRCACRPSCGRPSPSTSSRTPRYPVLAAESAVMATKSSARTDRSESAERALRSWKISVVGEGVDPVAGGDRAQRAGRRRVCRSTIASW